MHDHGTPVQVKDSGLQVALNPRTEGFVPVLLTSKCPDEVMALKSHFSRGQAVRCTVLGCESGKGHLHNLSMIGGPHPTCTVYYVILFSVCIIPKSMYFCQS